MVTRADLLQRKCRPQHDAIATSELPSWLAAVPDWSLQDERIVREFPFRDYRQTIAFVNTVADIANEQDHHPEMLVGYNRCAVHFNTHSVNGGQGGLSENDFVCAARVDRAFDAMAHT